MSTAKDLHRGAGSSGIFGELFIGLGLLIGLAGVTFWVLHLLDIWPKSTVSDVAAHGDWLILSFFFVVEGLGFLVFGIMVLVSGWDRHHHADIVH